MILEEQARYEVLLEDLQRDVRLIADGHVALTERLDRTEAKFEQRFERVEQQIMVLDVKVNQKIDALDAKVDALDAKVTQKVDALDAKVDALDMKLSAELSRIATHLGLNDAPRPRPRQRPRKRPRRG